MEVIPGHFYKNLKNQKFYKVVALAKHSETLDDMVVYEAQYENEISKHWARPLELFKIKFQYIGEKI